jgi:hypothetical protein
VKGLQVGLDSRATARIGAGDGQCDRWRHSFRMLSRVVPGQ